MHISGLKQSRFLTRADVGRGKLVTIRQVYEDNVAKEGAPEEWKWVMQTDELEKPMVLNPTNGQIIAKALGSEETDEWVGKQIVLYDDPNITFGGKLVGGIRARAVRTERIREAEVGSTRHMPPTQAPARPAPTRPAPAPARPAPARPAAAAPPPPPETDPGLPPEDEGVEPPADDDDVPF